MAISYKSFAITIRPKDGIDNGHLIKFETWVRARCIYYYVITEKQLHEKHIHAALFFHTPQRTDNTKRSLNSLFSFTGSERQVAVHVKPVYNHNWDNYMRKQDDTVVILNNLPEKAMLESYFTVGEEYGKSKTGDQFYYLLEKLWYEHMTTSDEMNPSRCRDFLFDMMYNKRLINVLRDDKTIIQVSRHLSRFLKKTEYSCIDVNTLYEKDE